MLRGLRVKPRVLLADDHAALREVLGHLLAAATDLVGQVSDGRQLVDTARRLSPDIVVTDMAMPEMSGLDAMRQLKAEGSTARFIVLTVDRDPRVAAEAIRAGASAYVFKHAAGDELLDAIRAVVAGETYLSPPITLDPG
jgi:DNA-binding NarL/FixJ family response regulator